VARSELTLPHFPHMTDEQQDLAVDALAAALGRGA
jgi:dTDP-4-amino-4,6-dideoxygalactose transaminase